MSSWRNETGYLARYLGSGVLNTAVGFAVIFLLMAFGVSPYVSNVAGYMVGILLGFVVSRNFVFRSGGHLLGDGGRYIVCFLISFLANLLVLKYALDILQLSKEISQLIAAATYTSLMYIFSHYLVFVNKN